MEAVWDVHGHRSPAQLLEALCIQNEKERTLVLKQTKESFTLHVLTCVCSLSFLTLVLLPLKPLHYSLSSSLKQFSDLELVDEVLNSRYGEVFPPILWKNQGFYLFQPPKRNDPTERL